MPSTRAVTYLPQPDGQQMGQQKRRQKNFEKLRREDAPFLHDARVPHAERGRALRALEEEELPGGEVLVSGGVPGQPGQGRPPVQTLTWSGARFPAGWTNPKSSLSFSSRCFRLPSSSPYSLPQTGAERMVKAKWCLPHPQQDAHLPPKHRTSRRSSQPSHGGRRGLRPPVLLPPPHTSPG